MRFAFDERRKLRFAIPCSWTFVSFRSVYVVVVSFYEGDARASRVDFSTRREHNALGGRVFGGFSFVSSRYGPLLLS